MVRCHEQVTKTKREAAAKLSVYFQAALLGIRKLAVVLHAARADAAGAVNEASAGHFDMTAIDAVIATGGDDAGRDARRALRSRESK